MDRPRQQPSVLVVDDDRETLDGLAAVLRDGEPPWHMEFLTDPRAAVDLLRKRDIDLIVSDLSMPGMDGLQLLEHVRTAQPHAVRIILTGSNDENDVVRAIPFAHQCLQKPIDPVALYSAIDRALTASALVARADLRAVIGNARALPSAPRLYAEVSHRIANPDIDMEQIAAIVDRDPAMAAKVLQLANCAYYRSEQPLVTVRAAVTRIGLRTLANCVLAAELFQVTQRTDAETARLMAEIEDRARRQTMLLTQWCEDAADLRPDFRELLPTAGLLHEVGALMMVQFDPLSYRSVHHLALRHRLPVAMLELRIVGVDHARLGGSLLGLWGLPWPLVDTVANHHDPDRAFARVDACSMLAAAEMFVATPWLCAEFERRAGENGWGPEFARMAATAAQLLRGSPA